MAALSSNIDKKVSKILTNSCRFSRTRKKEMNTIIYPSKELLSNHSLESVF